MRATACWATVTAFTVSAGVAAMTTAADAPTTAPALPPVPVYECRRAVEAPVIDGRADDAAWTTAAEVGTFGDLAGRPDHAPRHATRAKLAWDEAALYVLAEMDEPDVWATMTERESVLFREDAFELFLDPDGDRRHYCELQVGPLNAVWDLVLTRPYVERGRANSKWNVEGLRTAVGVRGTLNEPSDRDEGWTVEIAIPWEALRGDVAGAASLPPQDGDEWRINCVRVDWPKGPPGGVTDVKPKPEPDYWSWSPAGETNTHVPERWGRVRFAGRAQR